MTMIGNLLVPAIMAIAGTLLLAMSGNAVAKEVGKALLLSGLMALAFYGAGHRINL